MPWRTVKDNNIAYGMEVKKAPRKRGEAWLDQILKLVGLTKAPTSTPTRYRPPWSSGWPWPEPSPPNPTCY